MTLQDECAARREDYLDGRATHADFRLWLADRIGLTDGRIPATAALVAMSRDAHLNAFAALLRSVRVPFEKGE